MSWYLFRVLAQKLWIVAIIALVAGAVSYYFLRDKPQKYKSTAQVSARFEPGIGILTSKTAGHETQPNLQNHIEAMKTEFIGTIVSYNLLLHDLTEDIPFRGYGFAPLSPPEHRLAVSMLRDKLNSFEILSRYDKFESKLIEVLSQRNYEVARWVNDGDLTVERIGDTNFIKVECLSENPYLSAFIVNTLCSEYIRYDGYPNQNESDSLYLLSELVARKKKQLEAKTEALSHYQATVRTAARGGKDQSAPYNVELREAELRVDRWLASLRAIKSKIAQREGQLARTDKVDPENSPKVVELQTKIDDLNKIYVEKGSGDKQLEATISNFRSQLQAEMKRLALESIKTDDQLKELIEMRTSIESDYKRAESNLLSVRSNANRQLKDRPTDSGGSHDIVALERARDSALMDYKAAAGKLERATNTAAHESSDGAALKLMVMGEPNAEPETFDALTIAGVVMGVSGVLTSIIILISAYVRTPRRPIHPTFVVTRSGTMATRN